MGVMKEVRKLDVYIKNKMITIEIDESDFDFENLPKDIINEYYATKGLITYPESLRIKIEVPLEKAEMSLDWIHDENDRL